MLLESDRRRAQVIEEKLGSVVLNAPADEGRYQLEAGCQRADAVIAVKSAAGTPAAGKSIGSLGLPDGAAIGGIVRKGAVVHADDTTKLLVGDRIVVLSPTKVEADVRKALFG